MFYQVISKKIVKCTHRAFIWKEKLSLLSWARKNWTNQWVHLTHKLLSQPDKSFKTIHSNLTIHPISIILKLKLVTKVQCFKLMSRHQSFRESIRKEIMFLERSKILAIKWQCYQRRMKDMAAVKNQFWIRWIKRTWARHFNTWAIITCQCWCIWTKRIWSILTKIKRRKRNQGSQD